MAIQHSWWQGWKKFDFANYFRDFSGNTTAWQLAIGGLALLFPDPFLTAFDFLLVNPFLSKFAKTWWADIILLAYLLIALRILINRLKFYSLPSPQSVVFITGFFAIYYYYQSFQHYEVFTFHTIDGIPYATVFILSSVLLLISYKCYQQPLHRPKSPHSLLDDEPDPSKYNDFYKRQSYAASVAEHIEHTTSDVAFAVSIIGDWGSGKTDFMLRIKSILTSNENENIICDFNPWRANKPDAIIEQFFIALSNTLQPYNRSIANVINDYSKRVLQSAEEPHYKFFGVIASEWIGEDPADIQYKYQVINQAIRATGKRLVIFIDDVDRLTGKETIEVLRIIRNTANFSNTFFIVGLDQRYIVEVLRKDSSLANEEEYLKKVFQLTITLPAFKKEFLKNEARKLLSTGLDKDDRNLIEYVLYQVTGDLKALEYDLFTEGQYESLLEQMVDSVRDLKRIANSFRISFNALKDEVEMSDLFVLELIRNKSLLVYQRIRDKSLLIIQDGKFQMDKTAWDAISKQLIDSETKSLVRSMDYILMDHENKNARKLVLPHNFYLYFSFQLFNLISFKEFTQALEYEQSDLETTLRKWIEEGKKKELLLVLRHVGTFKNADQLQKIVLVFLSLAKDDDDWYRFAKYLIHDNWKFDLQHYFKGDKKLHEKFFLKVMAASSLDLLTRASIADHFLEELRHSIIDESQLFISRRHLGNIVYYLFWQFLQNGDSTGIELEQFYKLNDYVTVNGYVRFGNHVNELYRKKLLTSQKTFETYIKSVIRPSQIPHKGLFVFDPYLVSIFGDITTFNNRLNSFSSGSKEIEAIKQVVSNNLESFIKGRKPFEIMNISNRNTIEAALGIQPA